MIGRILSVSESDSSSAAGIQADIKTVLALGGYATTAVTCVLAQSTKGAASSRVMEPAFVVEQMRAVLNDIGTDAIKVGFLNNRQMIDAVADVLDEYQNKNIPVVIDPSIVLRNGQVLVDELAVAAWKRRLYIRATVLTPNLREAEVLTGMHIKDIDAMRHATDMMRTLGVENVVLKAGQAISDKLVYFVANDDGEKVYERPRIDTGNTLGAGGTLSTAIAVSLAQGLNIHEAVERSLDYLQRAMESAQSAVVNGPMNHAFHINKNQAFYNVPTAKSR